MDDRHHKAPRQNSNQQGESEKKRSKEPPATLDPSELFLCQVWYKPFHEAADSLLWKP